ncbi:hypothetical protein [Pseudomonas fluvialis]|jgi:hypothetical protein|uniref:Lipoprotein n=1 Tax=Pseudomonas fluvialis TaxID=1793966 RepID=A0ABQ2ADJ5_9PSED|nr:hypothetical protein [Pseudomonas fluvialis]MBP8264025.1 hypothetical protein [Pseudomonas sp.]GGH88907.1 hypothetical protein GCM10007363_02740 [Pseudomonas fluvialis]
MRARLVSAIPLLASALLVTGCANQLPQRSEHEERIERSTLDHSIQIDLGQTPLLQLPQRRIRFTEQYTYELSEFEVVRRYDRYTPYQPWRELYEVPLGALAIVGGVTANVLNVALLGSLPKSATRDWIRYGVAGINPLMNVESNGRAEQNLASIEETLKDKRLEHSSLPWAERPVSLQAAEQHYELLTDRHGVLHLNLLDNPLAEQDLDAVNHLQLAASDGQVRAEARLLLSRSLRGKLKEAHALVYDDLESDSVERWVERVQRLSSLGLEEEASELEQSLIELTRNDPELQAEFIQLLLNKAGRIAVDPGEGD